MSSVSLEKPRSPRTPAGRKGVNVEKWGWIYMRASGVVLVVPGGPRRAGRRPRGHAGPVVVRGDVGELVLHAYGRGAAARVHVLGEPTDLVALGRATGV